MITRKIRPVSASLLRSTLRQRTNTTAISCYTSLSLSHHHRSYSSNKRNVHLSTAAAAVPPIIEHHHHHHEDHHSITTTENSSEKKPISRPLSRLPFPQLLRSLLIATISSHRFLLLPALHTLQFLTARSHTSTLLSVDKNPIIHGVLKTTFYNQFCAGETGQETRRTVRALKDLGFRGVILTYARETMFDHRTKAQLAHFDSANEEGSVAAAHDADIEDWRRGTLETAALVEDGDFLAIKLTGAGTSVTSAFAARRLPPKQMLAALREICEDCASRSVRVIVDAESQHFQHGIALTTLQLMREFNGRIPGEAVVYNTYQAYLKATPDQVAEHMRAAHDEGFTLGLKVVRGAYILSDDRKLIHDTKQDTDDAYNSIARGALQQSFREFGSGGGGDHAAVTCGTAKQRYPFPSTNLLVASHNRESVFAAYELHRERVAAGLPTVPVVFGQLHGMSDEVSFGLLEHGRNLAVNTAHSLESKLDSATPRAVVMDSGAGGSTLADEAASAEGPLHTRRDRGAGPSAMPHVFKCTTWGSMSECIAYLVRRAVENRDAVLRTSDEYTALKSELWRRLLNRT